MNNKKERLQCIGCGEYLQTKNSEAPGYILDNILNDKNIDELYCQRCFKLKHYNVLVNTTPRNNFNSKKNILSIFRNISKNSFIINVIDIFNFDESLIKDLSKFIKSKLIVVVNKIDILPKSVNILKIKQWILIKLKSNGIIPYSLIMISAKKGYNVDKLIDLLKNKKGQDIYLFGISNSGKSTLTNRIVETFTDKKNLITTSNIPGTTLKNIKILLSNGCYLIDTPGIDSEFIISKYFGSRSLKSIFPQKRINPKVYQLNPKQSLFIGGIIRMDYISSDNLKKSFVIYTSNRLSIHRTKLENADNFYRQHVGNLLTPPNFDDLKHFCKMSTKELYINKKSDIVFENIGWIKVPSNVHLSIKYPKLMHIFIREPLL